MNKLCIFTVLTGIVTISSAFAETEEEKLYVKPNSAKGSIVIVNRQSLVDDQPFTAAIKTIRKYRRYVVNFTRDEGAARGATVALSIVDDPADPAPMTVSPEIGRGKLNVAALTNDLRSAASVNKFLPQRARMELLRLICYAFGVGGSQFSGNILSATVIRDLDFMKPVVPVDALDNFDKSATKRGMKPEIALDYYDACQEGWAPKPTTDYEKKTWDEVHALPTKPIKILPPTQQK